MRSRATDSESSGVADLRLPFRLWRRRSVGRGEDPFLDNPRFSGSSQRPVIPACFVRPGRPPLGAAEGALWIVAAATLGYCGYAYASAALHQNQRKAAFKTLQAEADPVQATVRTGMGASAPPTRGEVLGIPDIPRIGLSSVVEQGVDSAVLSDSVGHIPGTALPGQDGNAALAAHRDTYFRHRSQLRSGDEIIFRSISATYTYTVQSTSIVQPTDTTVLAGTKRPTLTLVTCFPFYYVGSAPKRFVLVATQSAVTEAASSR